MTILMASKCPWPCGPAIYPTWACPPIGVLGVPYGVGPSMIYTDEAFVLGPGMVWGKPVGKMSI